MRGWRSPTKPNAVLTTRDMTCSLAAAPGPKPALQGRVGPSSIAPPGTSASRPFELGWSKTGTSAPGRQREHQSTAQEGTAGTASAPREAPPGRVTPAESPGPERFCGRCRAEAARRGRCALAHQRSGTMPQLNRGARGWRRCLFSQSPPGQRAFNPADSHQLRITHALPHVHKRNDFRYFQGSLF